MNIDQVVVAIYDSAAGVYSNYMNKHNAAVAIREFEEGCQEPTSRLHVHAEHFSLRQVGTTNLETGQIEPMEPFVLMTAEQAIQVSTSQARHLEIADA